METKAPIIIIGMHRSGTSLLTKLLENLGLFVGKKKEGNNEAIFFKSLNLWMARQASAWWDAPGSFNYLLQDNQTLKLIEDYIYKMLNGPRCISYLGLKNYLLYGRVSSLDFPWGWKDPLNTFLLPVWLRLFPDARVIYIERHGVDVAQSLKVRRDKDQKLRVERYQKKSNMLYSFQPKRDGFSQSLRCATLEGAFTLWEEYVQRGHAVTQMLPENRKFTLKYEDLLENGEENLAALAEFCGLKCSYADINALLQMMQKTRAYAFRSSSELSNFANMVSSRLKLKGYSP